MPEPRSPRILLLAALAVSLAGVPVVGQVDWRKLTPTNSPPGRAGHAVAYDAARQRTVLFGGFNGTTGDCGDTWEWDRKDWTQRNPAISPPARNGHAMAYDAARRRTVLFGGWRSGLPRSWYADTWVWDGQSWTQLSPATSPPRRAYHAMAYDAGKRRVVLFGASGLGDTWEWDGSNWTQRMPTRSPTIRSGSAMVYDAANNRVLLFGGYYVVTGHPQFPRDVYANDTWEWDGNTWTQLQSAVSPPGRAYHAMACDATRRRTVLFGGHDGTTYSVYYNDTWEWNRNQWMRRAPATSPSARWCSAMSYDAAAQRVILFGGGSSQGSQWSSDTWEFLCTFLHGSGTNRPGGTVDLSLTAPIDASRPYQIGSSLGTGPIRIGNRILDLSPDDLLAVSTGGFWPWVFSGYRGTIDSQGRAKAVINIPNLAALVGTRIHSAFVTLDPNAPWGIKSVSNTFTFSIAK